MVKERNSSQEDQRGLGWKPTLLVSVGVLLLGGAITALIFYTEPTAVREGATRETAMLVQVTGVEQGSFRPTIVATGTVQPALDIILRPRVGGEIIDQSPNFTPGGFIAKDESLMRLDPKDYENVLHQRQSDLHQATADLDIEMGLQDVARKDYLLLDERLSGTNESLVLRKPQLSSAIARVEAAQSLVSQAGLELARTKIIAPFDAQVLSRTVNIGSQVEPGDPLGRLVGIDTYWVEISLPLAKLRWLTFPDEAGTGGSEVRLRDHSSWTADRYRTGRLFKLVGALEEGTRMARVLAAVEDPLSRRPGSANRPVMIIGAFVEASIQGRTIENVIRLKRDYIRKNNTVWVMQDDSLAIRRVEIVLSDREYAYISKGLQPDDRVVITNLATVAEGAPLRLKDSGGSGDGQQQPETYGRQQNGGM